MELVLVYDEIFSSIGVGRFLETEQFVAWSTGMEHAGFSITKPFDGEPATVGNGTMIAIMLTQMSKWLAFIIKR